MADARITIVLVVALMLVVNVAIGIYGLIWGSQKYEDSCADYDLAAIMWVLGLLFLVMALFKSIAIILYFRRPDDFLWIGALTFAFLTFFALIILDIVGWVWKTKITDGNLCSPTLIILQNEETYLVVATSALFIECFCSGGAGYGSRD